MSRKRFIAGAVCPECGEMDRLVVETEELAGSPDTASDAAGARSSTTAEYRRCVNCGFTDKRPVAGAAAPKTRLDGGLKHPARDPDTPSDKVRIIDP